MIPRLTKMWGLSLQTGAKLISIFNSLSKLLMVILLSIVCGFLSSYYHSTINEPLESVMAVVITLLVTSVFRLITSTLLVFSTFFRQRHLAKPWLIVDMLLRIVDVFIFILSLIYHDVHLAIVAPIRIGIGLYFWLVVYNYYQELGKADLSGIEKFSGNEVDPLLVK